MSPICGKGGCLGVETARVHIDTGIAQHAKRQIVQGLWVLS